MNNGINKIITILRDELVIQNNGEEEKSALRLQ